MKIKGSVMDGCIVDWAIIKDILVALIGAGIPSIVAWVIYSGWSSQKGKEVIANEAKRLLVELTELILLVKKVNSNTLTNEDLQRSIKSFEFQKNNIISITDFIAEEISDKQAEVLNNMKSELNITNEALSKYIDKSSAFAVCLSARARSNNSFFKDLLGSTDEVFPLLRSLALYRST